MKLTRSGWACLLLTALTLMSAASTGNNLLYLLYGAQVAALLLSWAAGRRNLARLAAAAEFPDRVFRGREFTLRLKLQNSGRLPSLAVRAVTALGAAFVESVPAGGDGEVSLRCRLEHRGRNRLEDLALESGYPFGLIRHRRSLAGLEGLALPVLREVRAANELSAEVSAAGASVPRKGAGDELYGVREAAPEDDARLINWKLTARTGRPLVNEFCAPQAAKVVVRLAGVGSGEEAERAVSEAASAVRFHIDSGAEVRLLTPEGDLGFGKGLVHLDRALEHLALLGEGRTPRLSGAVPKSPGVEAADSPGQRRALFALAGLVWASLYLIEEINPRLLNGLAWALPLGLALQELSGPRLPRLLWDLASSGMLFYILLYDWRVSGVALANAHLILYLVVNRCLNPLSAAETRQFFLILFLAFFLVSGLTISPWYFLFFVLYLGLSGAWLSLAQGLSARAAGLWLPALGLWLSAALAVTALLFAATPRWERFRRFNPFVAMGVDKLAVKPSSAVGFTEDVSLGHFGALKKSTARVMRVKAEAWTTRDKPPPLRIRGAAYDLFDGVRWRRSHEDFRYRLGSKVYWSTAGHAWGVRKSGRVLFSPGPAPRQEPQWFDFVFYPMNLAVLFTVGGPWAVETESAAYFDFTDSVYFAAPYLGGGRYRLLGEPGRVGFSQSVPGYERFLRRRFLQLYEGQDPRVRELARRLAGPSKSALEKARAVEAHLRSGYSYSTYSEVKGRGVEDFLFKTRKGNCEYFATAAVVLLRHAGVPARLVTGFVADDWNEFGRFYDVRQGQAHAWAEAYVGAQGWVTVEPTPPSGGLVPEEWLAKLSKYYEAAEFSWYRNVIGYDFYVQANTFHRLGRAVSREALWRALRFAGLGLLAGLVGWASWLASRALSRRRGGGEDFFSRAERSLSRAGLPRARHLTPREYAAEVARRRPELSALGELAELHYLERYSPRGLGEGGRGRADMILAELRTKL